MAPGVAGHPLSKILRRREVKAGLIVQLRSLVENILGRELAWYFVPLLPRSRGFTSGVGLLDPPRRQALVSSGGISTTLPRLYCTCLEPDVLFRWRLGIDFFSVLLPVEHREDRADVMEIP